MRNKPQPLLTFRRDQVRESIWTPHVAASPPPATAPLRCELEVELVAILTMPLANGMSAADGFYRKEAAVFDVLAQLDPAQALQLRVRLRSPRVEDDLAQAFQRFTAERRQRVMAFLGDARRRVALAASRRDMSPA
jgi:hypothetical protein